MTPAVYTPGHSAAVTAFMARRRAETHAAFVLPLLRPGDRVLDLGCGPGTITAGLAARVAPGSVLGVDMNAAQIEAARALARERGLPNATFEIVRAEFAEWPEAAFDLVFAHAVFEHVAAPVDILRRLRAVLRPGGCIALRSPEWGGFVLEPMNEHVQRALDCYERMQAANGGNLRAGRKLGRWLAEAGFSGVRPSASYEIYEDPRLIADYLAAQLEAKNLRDEGTILRAWAREPHALFAQAWFEAIGFRPSES